MATFRGRPACSCLIEWLPVYEGELLRRGVIKNRLDIFQLIGGALASGGTHSTGGAFDVGQTQAEAIAVARQMGADATWHRPKNWDNADGMEHTHGVLRGCPHNGPARYQIAAVDAGYNGLGKGGRAAKDTGPRPLSKRTFKQGIEWAKTQGVDMALTDADIIKIWETKNIPGPYPHKSFPDGRWTAKAVIDVTAKRAVSAAADAAAALALVKVLTERGTSLTAADIEAAVAAGIDAKIDTATVNLTTS